MRKLNTKNCCFLCLQSNKIKIEDYNENCESALHRNNQNLLRCLMRHLRINLNGVEATPLNSNIATQDDTDVKVDLCEDCAQLNSRFSKLFLQLEKIQMEMNFYLEEIHRRISESSKNAELVQNYSMEMTSDRETLSQLVFVDKLRKKIANNTIRKKSNPRVCLTRSIPTKVQSVKQEAEEIEDFNDTDHFEDNNPGECIPALADSSEQSDLSLSADMKPEVAIQVADAKIAPSKVKNYCSRNLSTGKYHCTICRKPFTQSYSVRLHYEAVHLKKTYKCDSCKMSFAKFRNMLRHKKICKGVPTRIYRKPLNVKYFVRNSTTGKYNCTSCKKPFKFPSDVRLHYESVHIGFKCDVCNVAKFSHPKSLQKHKIKCNGEAPVKIIKENVYYTHDKVKGIFQCTKCEKQNQTVASIVSHYETVHLQKRYKCDICNLQEFTRTDSLKRHQKKCRDTLEERLRKEKELEKCALICPLCGKRFLSKVTLGKHRQLVHLYADRYPCDLCDKKFKKKFNLTTHRDKVHFGKRFECRFCRKNCWNDYLQKRHELDCPCKNEVKIELKD